MFEAGCRSDGVDKFTNVIGIVATMSNDTPSLHRGHDHYVIRRRPNPFFVNLEGNVINQIIQIMTNGLEKKTTIVELK